MAARDYALATDRLILRPTVQEDVDQLQGVLSDPDVVKTLLGDASTPEAVQAMAGIWISEPSFWQAHGFGYWGVFDRQGEFGTAGALIGLVGADKPPPVIGEGPEIYYFFARHVWGRRVGGEAVLRMCDYLFGVVGLPALEALVFAELNPASVRIAEKLGMRLVGRSPLVGHHLNERRARETMKFDIWRVRQTSPSRSKEILGEATFRLGQLLAEGAWSSEEALPSLLDACEHAGLCQDLGDRGVADLIKMRLAEGIKAKGIAHYRVRHGEYAFQR
jgi:RimJ/RimL family protein N-acetyltransferase